MPNGLAPSRRRVRADNWWEDVLGMNIGGLLLSSKILRGRTAKRFNVVTTIELLNVNNPEQIAGVENSYDTQRATLGGYIILLENLTLLT